MPEGGFEIPKKSAYIAGGVCCGIVTLISIILISISFRSLAPTELGLEYNSNTKHLDNSKLWKEGLHHVGPGHYFIKFPRILQTQELDALDARTRDGLKIVISASYQWQLLADAKSLFDLYMLFEENYEAAFAKIAKGEIRNVAAKFTAFQFFFNRTAIGVEMGNVLSKNLLELKTSIQSFQLLNFDLPNAFEEAIQETEETRQKIETEKQTQEKVRELGKSKVDVATEAATKRLIEAKAEAAAYVSSQEALRDSLNATLSAERAVYESLQQQLNLSSTQLMTLVWLRAVESQKARAVYALTTPPQLDFE